MGENKIGYHQFKKRPLRAIHLTYVSMFAALMMIGANITTFIPFLVIGGVPITLQSFFAILAGALLGSRLGSLAMTVYLLIGLIGAPVFSRFSGGFGAIFSPTFGFLLSFIVTAFITGKLVEGQQSNPNFYKAAFFGLAVNYIIGTGWLYIALKFWASAPDNFSLKMVLFMMIPPLPKDLILAWLASFLSSRIYKIIRKTS